MLVLKVLQSAFLESVSHRLKRAQQVFYLLNHPRMKEDEYLQGIRIILDGLIGHQYDHRGKLELYGAQPGYHDRSWSDRRDDLEKFFDSIGTTASTRNLSQQTEQVIKELLTTFISKLIDEPNAKIRALNRLAKPWPRTNNKQVSLEELKKKEGFLKDQADALSKHIARLEAEAQ